MAALIIRSRTLMVDPRYDEIDNLLAIEHILSSEDEEVVATTMRDLGIQIKSLVRRISKTVKSLYRGK